MTKGTRPRAVAKKRIRSSPSASRRVPMRNGMDRAPKPKKMPRTLSAAAALVPLVEVARQGVGPAVEPAAAEAEDDRRGEDAPVAGRPGEQQEGAGDEKGRDGQQRLEAEAVDEGAEEERRDEHGEVHRQEEVAGRARAEADALEERGQDGAQDGHDDAEDEDARPGRGLEPGDSGGAGRSDASTVTAPSRPSGRACGRSSLRP